MPVPKGKGPSLGVGQPGLQTPAPPPPAPTSLLGFIWAQGCPGRPRGEGPAATQTRRVCRWRTGVLCSLAAQTVRG